MKLPELILRSAIPRRLGGVRVFLFVVLALAALSFRSWAKAPNVVRPQDRHVVVVSLDGLGASFFAQAARKAHIPNLQKLRTEGSFAEGVVGVYPSVTYPSHTTLVTGRLPAQHGIYSNLASRAPGKNPHDWFWFSSAIKVSTLWDEAHRAHLTSAAISWPVTVGAAIDWNVPEIWDPMKGETLDLQFLARYSTPGLIPEAGQALGPMGPETDQDEVRTRFSAYLVKKHKPNLLLVHLSGLDNDEHGHGPGSREALATLEKLDGYLGLLFAAVKEAGLDASTAFFVVSDHGFLPVENEIRPNILLVRAGLLEAHGKGTVSGGKIATVSNGGSFFLYWPDSQNLRPRVEAALQPLRERGLVWAVFGRAALRDLGAEPAAQLALEAPTGWSFGSRASGELVTRGDSRGTHGYLPYRPELEASFIAWGPAIKAGVNLHHVRMTSVGPTILKAMGIDDPRFGNGPALVDIFK